GVPCTIACPSTTLFRSDRYYREDNANIHRGIHALSERATQRYEGAREKVRGFIGARSSESIVFTRGTTEAINLVRYAWGRKNIRSEEHTSELQSPDHPV